MLAIWFAPTIFLANQFHWMHNDLHLSLKRIYSLGWGKPSGLFLVGTVPDQQPGTYLQSSTLEVFGSIVLANTPQLYLTLLYYFWNSHLTVMLAAREYSAFAAKDDHAKDGSTRVEEEDEDETQQAGEGRQAGYAQVPSNREDARRLSASEEVVEECTERPSSKRGLRVTDPAKEEDGKQQSTYFLTIPFKYYLINASIQSVLHFLVSQAFFFARVNVLDHWEEISKYSISQCGYSVLGLISLVVVAFFTHGIHLWISRQKFDNRMPLAATCSGALSAACHPQNVHERHHMKEVHWGIEEVRLDEARTVAVGIRNRSSPSVVEDRQRPVDSDETKTEPPRCTFTSRGATYPTVGQSYG